MTTSAFDKGRAAGFIALPIRANPFTLKPYKAQWVKGWRQGRKEREAQPSNLTYRSAR